MKKKYQSAADKEWFKNPGLKKKKPSKRVPCPLCGESILPTKLRAHKQAVHGEGPYVSRKRERAEIIVEKTKKKPRKVNKTNRLKTVGPYVSKSTDWNKVK